MSAHLDTAEAAWRWALGQGGRGGAAGLVGHALRPLAAHRRDPGAPPHPGFWYDDGRCCGTAGVVSAVLAHDPAFAVELAGTLVERAVRGAP